MKKSLLILSLLSIPFFSLPTMAEDMNEEQTESSYMEARADLSPMQLKLLGAYLQGRDDAMTPDQRQKQTDFSWQEELKRQRK